MTQTSYVNPNGLPADGQITSARDLAILARAIIRDLPEYEYFVHIPSIRYGRRVTQNFNKLIGRYPGADGFKTGFICASGYNLVASATRNGKRLIAVVLGASSGTMRAVRAAQLLERGFANNGCRGCGPRSAPSTIWCRSTPRRRTCATRCAAASASGRPATRTTHDRRQQFRRSHRRRSQRHLLRRRPAAADAEAVGAAGRRPRAVRAVLVYTGPTRTGAALIAAVAADTEAAGTQSRAARKRASRPRSLMPRPTARPRPNPTAQVRHQADAKQATPNRRPPSMPAPSPMPAAKPAAAAAADKPAPKPRQAEGRDASTAAKPAAAQPRRRPSEDRRPSRASYTRRIGPSTPIAIFQTCVDQRAAACHRRPHCSILPQNKAVPDRRIGH